MSRKIILTALHAAAFAAVILGCSRGAQGAPTVPADPIPTVPADASSTAAAGPPTLNMALKNAPLDPGEFALAVGADKRPLPAESQLPGPLGGVSAVAGAFGQVSHRFGLVLAVAPPTMTALNTNLQPPDIYDGMPVGAAAKFLAASLTPAQWNALTGAQGLAAADLLTPDQRRLFQACIPMQTLRIYSTTGGDRRTVDPAAELSQARLRLGSRIDVMLPTSLNGWSGGPNYSSIPDPPHYLLDLSSQSDDAALDGSVPKYGSVQKYGNMLKTVISNKLKPGNLDFATPALRVSIPLDGLKTVGELVSRISTLTKIELYADPHYASRSVTVVAGASGTPDAASRPSLFPPAGDLLRALAFCLTATYRQVGPAYVLTDDLAGVGIRRQRFTALDAEAQRLRQKPLDAAGDIIAAQHKLSDLHPFEDGTDFSPTPDEITENKKPEFSMNTPGMFVYLPFSDLTPVQQAAAQFSDAGFATNHRPSLEGLILLQTLPTLELMVPSVPDPIDLGSADMINLFHSPRVRQATMMAQEEARRKSEAAIPHATPAPSVPTPAPSVPTPAALPPPPVPRLEQVFAGIPRRAALIDARTPGQVNAAVAAMKTIGLNQLWLPVFTEGKARIPGTPFSAADGPDLLAEAHNATQGTGIAVYAVLDLLTWGPDAPAAGQDLTLQGDNSMQAIIRQYQSYQNSATDSIAEPVNLSPAQKRLAVSPFAPSVQDALTSLVRAVGGEPGIAGIVWRETAPTGYATIQEAGDTSLGYTVDGRLAFLRRAHIDPIDISPSGNVDTRLPNWDSVSSDGAGAWRRFRVENDEHLLQTLLAAWSGLGPKGGTRPVLVQQRRNSWQGDWFGSWDGLPSPLPAYYNVGAQVAGIPPYPAEAVRQAKAQSKVALLRIDSGAISDPSSLASYLNEHLNPAKSPWDGFVVEYHSEEDGGIQALQSLAAAVALKPAEVPVQAGAEITVQSGAKIH